MSRAARICKLGGLSAAVLAALAAAPGGAVAAGTGGTPTCTAPLLSQVYSWVGDTNWYAAIPGESWDDMGATDWTLSGGAKFASVTLADGKKGQALYLPAGSVAISPGVCVTNSYVDSRGEVRAPSGTAGVNVSVSYLGATGYGPTQATGTLVGVGTGWTVPKAFADKPSSLSGWQYMRFTLRPGDAGTYYISNLYVGMRMR